MSSVFANVEEGAKIEVFALTASYNSDTFKDKVNLSVGGDQNNFSKFFFLLLNWLLKKISNNPC